MRWRAGFTPAAAKWPAIGLLAWPRRVSANASWTASYPSISVVLIWVTVHGPAWMTVTGTARESSVKICVIPSFVPRMPFAAIASPSELDLDVDARRQVQALQLLNRLRRGLHDVDQPLVGEHLEVLPAVLVLVRRPDDRVDRTLSRKRHRPNHFRSGPDDVIHDIPSRSVEDLVVVRPKLDPDARRSHQAEPPETRWARIRSANALSLSRICFTAAHTSGQSASVRPNSARTAASSARRS